MEQVWHYIGTNGATIGPVSESVLKAMLAAGQIHATTLVWKQGTADWVPLASALPGTVPATQSRPARKGPGWKTLLLVGLLLFIALWAIGRRQSDPPGPPRPAALEKQAPRPVPQKSREQVLAEDRAAVDAVEKRFKDNAESLKKYYATNDRLDQAGKDVLLLALVKARYEGEGKTGEETELARRSARLAAQVATQARKMYASVLEETFVKNGFDVNVAATGKDRKNLKITFALMSQPLVYKFQNEAGIQQRATVFGFEKLVYTNGFESSLGKTWTIDLRPQ